MKRFLAALVLFSGCTKPCEVPLSPPLPTPAKAPEPTPAVSQAVPEEFGPMEKVIRGVRSKGLPPQSGLLMILLRLRGDGVRQEVLVADAVKWERENGKPTWPELLMWAIQLDSEDDHIE